MDCFCQAVLNKFRNLQETTKTMLAEMELKNYYGVHVDEQT